MQGVSCGKAFVISKKGIPRRPLWVPVLSVPPGCPCYQEDWMPVPSRGPSPGEAGGEEIPCRRQLASSRSSSSASSAMATRGELEACQSSSPLIPPVQINYIRIVLPTAPFSVGTSQHVLSLPLSRSPATFSQLYRKSEQPGLSDKCGRLFLPVSYRTNMGRGTIPSPAAVTQASGPQPTAIGVGYLDNVEFGHHTRRPPWGVRPSSLPCPFFRASHKQAQKRLRIKGEVPS